MKSLFNRKTEMEMQYRMQTAKKKTKNELT